jgi:hypothetical protein
MYFNFVQRIQKSQSQILQPININKVESNTLKLFFKLLCHWAFFRSPHGTWGLKCCCPQKKKILLKTNVKY